MTKKPKPIEDGKQNQAEHKQRSRAEIDAALARLEEIARALPPVDVVATIREARDSANRDH